MEYWNASANSTRDPEAAGEDDISLIFVLQGLIIFIFALLIILTNVINLIVIPRLPDINDASKVFYNCLSAADLLLGLVLLPALPSAVTGGWPFGDLVCKICGFSITLVAGISSASLLLLNLDRYFSITSPMRYIAFMDQRKAIAISLGAFVFEMVFLLVILFVNPFGAGIIEYTPLGACIMTFSLPGFAAYSFTIFGLFIWSFLPILIIMYSRIICISKQHVKRIQVQELTTNTQRKQFNSSVKDNVSTEDHCADPDGAKAAACKKKTASHSRAIKMTLLITGTYLLAWMPFTICQMYVAMVTDNVSVIIRALVCWPLLLNPLCNAVIYSATKRSYRTLARKILRGCMHCSLSQIRDASSHEILV